MHRLNGLRAVAAVSVAVGRASSTRRRPHPVMPPTARLRSPDSSREYAPVIGGHLRATVRYEWWGF